MNDRRVLVTGGAGLIGSHIVDQLLSAGVEDIVVLDNFSRGTRANLRAALASGKVRIVEGDVRSTDDVGRAMSGAGLVFHQAAIRITQCAEDPALAMAVLANGTFNVLDAAVRAGVRRVVAASSASIYGLAEVFPTIESHHPYANRTLYGAAKLFNEGLLRSYYEMYGLDYIALRYFNVYGPRMDVYGAYTEVLIRWMERIASGEAPKIMGDGLQTMDFVHVQDIARANLLAADAPVTDMVFNVGSGVETSLRQLLDALLRVMDSSIEPEYVPARKVNGVTRRLAGTDHAWHHLGFRSEIPLEAGLQSLVAWWQQERLATAR